MRHGLLVYSVILNGLIVLQGLPIFHLLANHQLKTRAFPDSDAIVRSLPSAFDYKAWVMQSLG